MNDERPGEYRDDEYRDEEYGAGYDPEPAGDAAPGRRATSQVTPLGAGLAGALAGALLTAILLVMIGGNPFSETNEVTYRQIVVADVSADADSICWSTEPGRRDAPQECAILALDPELDVPEAGDEVRIGVVRLAPPEGHSVLQVVYVERVGGIEREPAAEPGEGGDAQPGGGAESPAAQ